MHAICELFIYFRMFGITYPDYGQYNVTVWMSNSVTYFSKSVLAIVTDEPISCEIYVSTDC